MKTESAVPSIFLAGDSTVWDATPDWFPMAGWGQMLPELFSPSKVAIKNKAFAGRSLRSFLDEGRLSTILEAIKAGDWLFIQFGHNDAKIGPGFAHPRGGYRSLLRLFAGEAQVRQAKVLLISPVERLQFGIDGSFKPSHGEISLAVRQVALETGIPCIDLTRLSQEFFMAAGPGLSRGFFIDAAPHTMERFPSGYRDSTHLSQEGARMVASLIARSLRDQNLEPAAWLA